MNIDNHEEEIKEELSDLDVDNLIEEWKSCGQEIERLKKLEEEKIQQVQYNAEQSRKPIENKKSYIEEQLKTILMNSPDKTQTKTLWKKKFISGEIQVKKAQKTIKNPNLKGEEAILIDSFKDFCEKVETIKFKWGEVKKKLKIVDDKILDAESGELISELEIEETPEELIIK